jgi:hypothetical protein
MATNLGKPVRLRNDGGAQLELQRGAALTTIAGENGNLAIGATSPSTTLGRNFTLNGENPGTNTGVVMQTAGSERGLLFASDTQVVIGSTAALPVVVTTNNAERARITADGYLHASDSGVYADGSFHQFRNTANARAILAQNTNASLTASVLDVNADRNTSDGTYRFITCTVTGVAVRFQVEDSGTVLNSTGTYGTISDEKVKQDIEDAGSAWEDLKAVRFRKYRLKSDVEANPDAPAMLGVVAQELEQVMPGLVTESPDRDEEGNDLGTKTKAVKTSVLLLKAAVALQEAMARIESLETRLAALESSK